jgi:3-oxoacyl-[acyl-carrier-protein] synthase-3
VPSARVDNERFSKLTGKDPEWFIARTGIHSRSRAAAGETTTSMGCDAVRQLIDTDANALEGVDLIIGSSYTPDDTLSTLPARVQRQFNITDARVYFVSTACSSFISALEIARLMLWAGEAKKALIVVSEHNSNYSDDADRFSGHLWGDGAAAILVSTDRTNAMFSVDYVRSRGVACAGKGPDAITLNPAKGNHGLLMKEGRDVFARACEYLAEEVRTALTKLKLTIGDVDWLVPHQANLRILTNVAKGLGMSMERCAVTVDQLGNTGCASIPISIQHVLSNIKSGHMVAAAAFGGGYSSGAAILTKT